MWLISSLTFGQAEGRLKNEVKLEVATVNLSYLSNMYSPRIGLAYEYNIHRLLFAGAGISHITYNTSNPDLPKGLGLGFITAQEWTDFKVRIGISNQYRNKYTFYKLGIAPTLYFKNETSLLSGCF
jgi:hypothetical protein